MGQANTLNKGWKMSKGAFLGYLSADDELASNAISRSLLHFDDTTIVTYCDFNLIDPQSRHIRRVQVPDFDYSVMFGQLVCPPGPGAFFRRSAFEATGGWDGKYRQIPDYEFWLRLGLIGSFRKIPEVLASFRVHEDSQSFGIISLEKAIEPVQVISRFIQLHTLPAELSRLENRAHANAWIMTARAHFRSHRYFFGISALGYAFSYSPRVFFTWQIYRLLINSFVNRPFHRFIRMIHR